MQGEERHAELCRLGLGVIVGLVRPKGQVEPCEVVHLLGNLKGRSDHGRTLADQVPPLPAQGSGGGDVRSRPWRPVATARATPPDLFELASVTGLLATTPKRPAIVAAARPARPLRPYRAIEPQH